MSVLPQQFPKTPRKDVPRLIPDGALLRLQQFNDSMPGANFRGGFFLKQNTRWPPTFFPGMDRLMFLRSADEAQLRLVPHERLDNYRVIYRPRNYFVNLVDYTVSRPRGIVLELVLLTLRRPNTNEIVWAGQTPSGRDIWCTDVCLAGCDMSYQIWMRHVPLDYLFKDIEACERWLFGITEDDEIVTEI